MISSFPSIRQNALDNPIQHHPTCNNKLLNSRRASTSHSQPTPQQIIALLRLDIIIPSTHRNMRHLIRALPLLALVHKSDDNSHDSVIPDDSLEQDFAITQFAAGVRGSGVFVKFEVVVPE